MYFIRNMKCINLSEKMRYMIEYEVHIGYIFIYNIKYIEYRALYKL